MSDQTALILMVFVVGFLLTQAFVRPLMGTGRDARRRLRERIRDLSEETGGKQQVSLVHERHFRDLSHLARALMRMPGMDALGVLVEQSGSERPPHRVVLVAIITGAAAGMAAGQVLGWGTGALLIGLLVATLPFMQLRRQHAKRIARFEEQLPDALTVIDRSLRAGLPFGEALNLVAREMPEPIGRDFGIVFNE